jgi:hypothetical protein
MSKAEVTKQDGGSYFVSWDGSQWRVDVFDLPDDPDESMIMSITARIYLMTADGTFKEKARTGPSWVDEKDILLILDQADDEDEESECVASFVDALRESDDELEEHLSYGGVRYPSSYGDGWERLKKPLSLLPPPHNK